MPITASSAGTSDLLFVQRCRDFLEDQPLFSPEQISSNGTSTEYRVSQFPILDNDTQLSIKVGATSQTLVADRAGLASANQVYVDYESGWLFWNTAPTSGTNNIQIRKSRVRWRNEKILDALGAGLRAMFPVVWQTQTDTSIAMSVNQWDYTLPTIFNDPRICLYEVEVLVVPQAYERYQPIGRWRRVGNTILQLPTSQYYPPGSTVRLTFAGPYQSLADLEDQLLQLPLWYAKGVLISNKEIVRVRFDSASATQDQQTAPVGSLQNAGTFFLRQFETELARLHRPMPMAPPLVTYGR